jgi:hypothetical protein
MNVYFIIEPKVIQMTVITTYHFTADAGGQGSPTRGQMENQYFTTDHVVQEPKKKHTHLSFVKINNNEH